MNDAKHRSENNETKYADTIYMYVETFALNMQMVQEPIKKLC